MTTTGSPEPTPVPPDDRTRPLPAVAPAPSPSRSAPTAGAEHRMPPADARFRGIIALCLFVGGMLLFISPNFWLIPDPYGDARRVALIGGTILAVFGVLIGFRRPSPAVGAGTGGAESGLVMMALGVGIGIVGWLLSRDKGYAFLGVAAMAGAGLVGVVGFARLLFSGVRRTPRDR
jgi:hypothetical protein